MQNRILVGAIVGAIAGCANMTESQKGTATGAGIGAAAGAAIGAIAGGGKGAAIGAGIGAAAGAGGGYLWSQRMQEQKQAMEAATQGTGVVVTQTPNNELKLEIPSDISFDLGKADVKPALRPVLDKFAQTLQANPVTYHRSHRQHRYECGQRCTIGKTRRKCPRLPHRARRDDRQDRHRRTGFA